MQVLREMTHLKSPKDDCRQKYPLLKKTVEMIPQPHERHNGRQDMQMQKDLVPSMAKR